MICSRCSRVLARSLCPCCDLPRLGSFSKTPICEHRPEFEEFIRWAAVSGVYGTYTTWWDAYRKPKPKIEISSSSYSPFDGRLPPRASEVEHETIEIDSIQPILPILAVIPNLDSEISIQTILAAV